MNPKDRALAIKERTSYAWKRVKGTKLQNVKGRQKLVIDKEPDFIYNREGEVVGVDAWVRLFDSSGNEVKIDPHRRIINPPTVPRAGIIETATGKKDKFGRALKDQELTANPGEAFYEAVWDSVVGTPNAKGWRTRGTVTTIYGDNADGRIDSTSSSYSTARTGSNNTGPFDDSNFSVGQILSSGSYTIYESFYAFDSSAIDDSDVVTSVEFSLYQGFRNTSTSFDVEVRDYNWGPTITSDEWVSGDALSGHVLIASGNTLAMSSGSYQAFTSTPSFLSINGLKTGFVYLMINSSRHRSGTAPVGFGEVLVFQYASASGTTQDPKLDITHSLPADPVGIPSFTSRPNRVWRLR